MALSEKKSIEMTLSDSDEDIFVGPVTDKEKQKAARLNRRTQAFFPPVSWKLRSSNQSSVEPKQSPHDSPTYTFLERVACDFSKPQNHVDKQSPLMRRAREAKRSPYSRKDKVTNVQNAHFSGYTADISTADKTDCAVTEADSLEFTFSVDSLNSFTKDSLDIEQDSFKRSDKPGSPIQISEHSSTVDDTYDVREYLPYSRSPDPCVSAVDLTPEKRFTPLEMEELQKQLGTLAAEIQQNERHDSPVEAKDTSNECHSVVEGDHLKNLAYSPEKLDASSSSIPSPYDLDKQKLTASLLYDSRIDSSSESNISPLRAPLTKNRLDTVTEISEPSSTDLESRLASVRLSEIEKPIPKSPAAYRVGSTVSTPKQLKMRTVRNSTQLFEEYERHFLEEERLSGPRDPQTTYTVFTEEPHSGDVSVASSVETERHQETYTVSSDTTSVRSFTYSAYPPENEEYVGSVNTDHLGASARDISSDSLGPMSDGCPDGEFNDTLEEYEMLMKYGMDYILGKTKGVPEAAQKNKSFGVETSEKAPEISERRSTGSKSMSSSRSSESSTSNTAAPKNREITPSKASTRTPLKAASSSLTPASRTPKSYHAGCLPQADPSDFRRAASQRSPAPSSSWLSPHAHLSKLNDVAGKKVISSVDSTTPGNLKFKIPTKIPLSSCRTPRVQATMGNATPSPRPCKFLNAVQSPVGAYIHDSPTPVLLKNIKPKTGPSPMSREYERKQRPVWENVDALRNHKTESSENMNPNVGHGLRLVHYTKAPCIKLDDPSVPKPRLPRMGDRFEKLLDSPCPQVIRHEGRVRVNPSSPQFTAAVKAVRSNQDVSQRSETAGDVSVCVTQVAKRTNTLCQ